MYVELPWRGGRRILEGVVAADERVDLSAGAALSATGPLGGAPVAGAVCISFDDDRDDEVLEGAEIAAVGAEDGQRCRIRLATDEGTRTVENVLECRIGDDDAERLTPISDPLECVLADGTTWDLHGRIVAATLAGEPVPGDPD